MSALWPIARGLVSGCGYNIQHIASSLTPQSPEQEHRLWYQYYFHSERGEPGSPRIVTTLASFSGSGRRTGGFDATYDRTAVAFDNPVRGRGDQSYRHRFGLAPEIPRSRTPSAGWACSRASRPDHRVAWRGRRGLAGGHLQPHRRFFTGAYERRLIPVVGHNLPQEAPREFAEAILTLVRGSSGTEPPGPEAGLVLKQGSRGPDGGRETGDVEEIESLAIGA